MVDMGRAQKETKPRMTAETPSLASGGIFWRTAWIWRCRDTAMASVEREVGMESGGC